MTKRHFAAIAAALAEAHAKYPADDPAHIVLNGVAARLAYKLAPFNPAFDHGRFLRACRGEP